MARWAPWLASRGVNVIETNDAKAARQIATPGNDVVMSPAYQIAHTAFTYTDRKGKEKNVKVGDKSKLMRTCTSRWKVDPTRRIVAAEMKRRGIKPHRRKRKTDPKPPGVVDMWLGISTDEWFRMKDSPIQYIDNFYPLFEMGWTRAHCKEYLIGQVLPMRREEIVAELDGVVSPNALELLRWYIDALIAGEMVGLNEGIFGDEEGVETDFLHVVVPPKSSCTFCPFSSLLVWQKQVQAARRKQWNDLDTVARILVGHDDAEMLEALVELASVFIGPDPAKDWKQSLEVDRTIRLKRPNYTTFVHRRFMPLAEAVDSGATADDGDASCDSGYCFS